MKLKIIVMLSALATLLFATSPVTGESDKQVWYSNSINASISEGWDVGIRQEFRFGEDASMMSQQFSEIMLSKDLTVGFSLAVGYKQNFVSGAGGCWMMEKRPEILGSFNWIWWGINFSDENLLERRLFKYGDDAWRYRNKVKISLSEGLTSAATVPYVATEMFLDPNSGDIDRYRFFAGLSGTIADFGCKCSPNSIGVDFGYILQTDKVGNEWSNMNILVAGLIGNF